MAYAGFRKNGHDDARTASPRQEPFVYGSLGGRTISIVDAPASSSASPAPSVADPAAQAWAAVKDANSISALEAFISRFCEPPRNARSSQMTASANAPTAPRWGWGRR